MIIHFINKNPILETRCNMKKNKNKMCAWLITMALGLAIVGCSNTKMITTTQTTVQQSETTAVNTSNSTMKGCIFG